jgi:hypothetical protein
VSNARGNRQGFAIAGSEGISSLLASNSEKMELGFRIERERGSKDLQRVASDRDKMTSFSQKKSEKWSHFTSEVEGSESRITSSDLVRLSQ